MLNPCCLQLLPTWPYSNHAKGTGPLQQDIVDVPAHVHVLVVLQ